MAAVGQAQWRLRCEVILELVYSSLENGRHKGAWQEFLLVAEAFSGAFGSDGRSESKDLSEAN